MVRLRRKMGHFTCASKEVPQLCPRGTKRLGPPDRVHVNGSRGRSKELEKGWEEGGRAQGRVGREVTTHPGPHTAQCCIDLERGVLRLKAPFSELPFLPLYQEPGQ